MSNNHFAIIFAMLHVYRACVLKYNQKSTHTYIYIGKEKHQYVVIWLYQEYAYSGGSHTFTGGLLLSICTNMLPKEWQAKYCGFQWWLLQPSEYMALSLSFGCSDGMIVH